MRVSSEIAQNWRDVQLRYDLGYHNINQTRHLVYISFVVFTLMSSLLPTSIVATRIRGHIEGPHICAAHYSSRLALFIVIRLYSCLPSVARVQLHLPTLRALSSCFLVYRYSICFAKQNTISPRSDSNPSSQRC